MVVLSQYCSSGLFTNVVKLKNVGMKVWYVVEVVPLTNALDAGLSRGINVSDTIS